MCLRLSARRITEAGEARNLFACEVTRSIDRAPKPAIRSSNGGGETGTMDLHTCAGKTLITRKVPASCV